MRTEEYIELLREKEKRGIFNIPEKDYPLLCYITGVFLAKGGNIISNNRFECSLKDEEATEKLGSSLENLIICDNKVIIKKRHKGYNVRVNSKKLLKCFSNLTENYSRIPWHIAYTHEERKELCRGLLDKRHSIVYCDNRPTISITKENEKLRKNLIMLLLSEGFFPYDEKPALVLKIPSIIKIASEGYFSSEKRSKELLNLSSGHNIDSFNLLEYIYLFRLLNDAKENDKELNLKIFSDFFGFSERTRRAWISREYGYEKIFNKNIEKFRGMPWPDLVGLYHRKLGLPEDESYSLATKYNLEKRMKDLYINSLRKQKNITPEIENSFFK